MESFGARLRTARRRAGMSQVEIGGDRYTGSYVSHLESGRRQPTVEMARYFAARLQVPVSELLGSDPQVFEVQAAEQDVLEADLNARNAWLEHDFDQAGRDAERAAAAARRSRRLDSWWASMSLRARSLLAVAKYQQCWQLSETLADHEVAAGSGGMRAEMLVLASKARRAEGQLLEATERAQRAITAAQEPPKAYTALAHAYMAALAALAETGRLDETHALADQLRLVREHIESQHVRGLVAWTLGNLDFTAGNIDRGEAEHARAAELLKPEVNLRTWARFRSAAASMHLSAGIVTGAQDLLDRAALALSLVGNSHDTRELELAYAQLAIALGDFDQALRRVDAAVAEPCPLPVNELADAETLRATALRELDRVPEAQLALTRAATWYEEAGALPRAIATWKVHAELSMAGAWSAAGPVHSPQP